MITSCTQIWWVEEQLVRGKTLTPILALKGCGTMRLAAIIYTLRERGLNILTIKITKKDGSKYASYKLIRKGK